MPYAPTTPHSSSRCPTPFPGQGAESAPSLLCSEQPGSRANGHPHVQDDKSRTGSDAEVGRFQVLNGCSIPGGWGIRPQMSRPPFFLPLLCIALPDAVSWTGITTIQADTPLQFYFPTGPILQSWWLVTLNILHNSTESLGASEGFDCTQGTLHVAEVPHTFRSDGLIPSLTLFSYCMHMCIYICMCMHNHSHTHILLPK